MNSLPESDVDHSPIDSTKQSNLNFIGESPSINNSNESKTPRGFKITHLNVRSLVKNIDHLRYNFRSQKFDIISINETMLDNSIANNEIDING